MRTLLGLALFGITAGLLHAGQNWQTLAEAHPTAMAVVEHYSEAYDVHGDGTYSSVTHYRATVLKEPGIQWLSTYSDIYYVKYDKLSVTQARVIAADGTEVAVGEDSIKDMPMPAFGPFFLQNIHLVMVSFPQVEIGSTVDITVRAERTEPPLEGNFNLYTTLQEQIPIEHQEYTVTVPTTMPLRWKVFRGQVELHQEPHGQTVEYTWSKDNAEQIVSEPSMPPMPEVAPLLVASTIPDWPTVSRWYDGLCEPGMALTPEIEALVEEVVAGKETTEQKIEALFFWTSQNIRYVETTMSGEKAGFKPEPATVTFRNRYGVCRDKALLLTALLRHIGVDAYVTLISAMVKQEVAIPNLNFNHAIVAIRKDDGSYYFLDPTAEDSRQFLPFADQDQYALVCSPEGVDIQLTPLAPPEQNRLGIEIRTTVTEDGRITSHVTYTPTGFYDYIFRMFLNRMPPARREMIFKSIVGGAVPNAVLSDFSLSNLDDLYSPVALSFSFEAKNQAIQANDYLIFKAPSQANPLDFLLSQFLSGTSLETRQYPFWLMATMESSVTETIKLPAGYEVRSLPDPLSIRDQGLSLDAGFEQVGDSLVHSETFSISDHVFQGAPYQALRDALSRAEKLGDGRVILVRKGEAR